MLTKSQEIGYRDFHAIIKNDGLTITPENACWILFENDWISKIKTTDTMQLFLEDEKKYMVFRYGYYNDQHLCLVAQYEPTKCVSQKTPSISLIKKAAIDKQDFYYKDGNICGYIYDEKLRIITESILETLPISGEEGGLYIINNPPEFKAQLPDDRYGFYKIWHHGYLCEEKNYGECSMVFSIVGIYLQ